MFPIVVIGSHDFSEWKPCFSADHNQFMLIIDRCSSPEKVKFPLKFAANNDEMTYNNI